MAGPSVYFNSSVGIELLLGYKIEKEKLTTSTSIPPVFLYRYKKRISSKHWISNTFRKIKTINNEKNYRNGIDILDYSRSINILNNRTEN